ncbi:hypothetical protein Cni_G17493 [Canna indica]|uniref:BHLH domain-containing protein n=1 Tax=Canna indica TaxID=4628 RepID=A0AAQ3KH42_9LILI|nr:hypothetical protein Cni_G17493 [Canna indica]
MPDDLHKNLRGLLCVITKNMALEAAVFPQDLFGYSMRELFNNGGGDVWGYDFVVGPEKDAKHGILDTSCSSMAQPFDNGDVNSSSPETAATDEGCPGPAMGRRKRRRGKSMKNQEEVENQRMTHIAVERNRRKQMNEYLVVLRSLMPASYVQRSDQASIIGGAINFVKELEKLAHSLEARKIIKERSGSAPFADFFTFPQYSYSSKPTKAATSDKASEPPAATENQPPLADIEVTMVDSHANLKVLSRRRPKQLLRMVVELQNLYLTTLHLNVTTIEEMVLYSFSLKVEDECQLNSADEIAAEVHQIIGTIQEEAASL